MFWDNGETTTKPGQSLVVEQLIEAPHPSLDQTQLLLADVFDLQTASEMADLLASNDQLLDRILGT